jgi:hypothetical protein
MRAHRVDLERQKEKQMGRPLRKDILGTDAIGSFTGTATGVRVEFYDASLRTDGVIVKQRGAKTFKVCRVGDIAGNQGKDSTNFTVAVLKNGTPSAAGEMRLFGYLGSNSGSAVNIAKITKRVATDFSNNHYTWKLENDSSNDYIVLTAI